MDVGVDFEVIPRNLNVHKVGVLSVVRDVGCIYLITDVERGALGRRGFVEVETDVVFSGFAYVDIPETVRLGSPCLCDPILSSKTGDGFVNGTDLNKGRGVVVRASSGNVVEPGFVLRLQSREDLLFCRCEVIRFAGVVLQIVEFEFRLSVEGLSAESAGVDEFPSVVARHEVMKALGLRASVGLDGDGTFGPGGILIEE